MSDPKSEAPKTAPKAARKPGYSNPALRAMGLPAIRLPSRNWMIFWSVCATIGGGIYYDRTERKKIRQQYKDSVAFLGEKPMTGLEIPRKVTVFIAPPPGDYLDHVQTHFRAYIKPILTAAALDFEVKEENRQGEIRYVVAEGIRNYRREKLGLPKVPSRLMVDEEEHSRLVGEQQAEQDRLKEGRPKNGPSFTAFTQFNNKKADEASVSAATLSTQQQEALDKEITAKLEFDPESGVICVGRGAYKEYIAGLHEGWLGPLDDPNPDVVINNSAADFPDRERDGEDALGNVPTPEEEQPVQQISVTESVSGGLNTATEVVETAAGPEDIVTLSEGSPTAHQEMKEAPVEEEKYDPKKILPEIKRKPVPRPYITPDQYSEAELSEFYAAGFENRNTAHSTVSSYINQHSGNSTSPSGAGTSFVEEFFFSPIAVVPHRHILGFLNTPLRMYRYFNKRAVAKEVGAATVVAVTGSTRPYDVKEDPNLLAVEEYDWPSAWVKKGQDNGSEWVQPVTVDDRVMSKIRVYQAKSDSDEKDL